VQFCVLVPFVSFVLVVVASFVVFVFCALLHLIPSLQMRGIRVPDRETKKAPKEGFRRKEIGLHLEKVDKKEKKAKDKKEVLEKVSLQRNYRSLVLLVLGVLLVLLGLVVVVRMAG
jgi:hypothetical protein